LGVLLSKVRSGLTSLQIRAARGGREQSPEPVGAEQAEEVPTLKRVSGD
jgi:hypothetical protein